jgi:hypothetical protein
MGAKLRKKRASSEGQAAASPDVGAETDDLSSIHLESDVWLTTESDYDASDEMRTPRNRRCRSDSATFTGGGGGGGGARSAVVN